MPEFLQLGIPPWEIVLRSTVVYLFILFALRVTGRRSLGQRNVLDLVLILVVANSIQNAMIGSDTSLVGGLIAAATLFALDAMLGRFFLHHRISGFQVSGTPRVLVNNGVPIRKELDRSGISDDELMEILREHGFDDLSRIKTAVLEIDGTVSVIAEETAATYTHHHIHPRRKSDIHPS